MSSWLANEVIDALLPRKTSKLRVTSSRTPNRHRWARPTSNVSRNNKNKKPQKRGRQNPDFPLADAQDIYSGPQTLKVGRFAGTGIPDRLHAQLAFSDQLTLLGTPGGDFIYRANGMWDPRVAAGGGQPLYFSQMMALYQQYVVTHSSIEVQMVNRTQDTYAIGVCAHSDVQALTYNWLKKQNKGVTTLIAPAQGDVKRLMCAENTAGALALPGFINDNTTWGTIVTDPGNLWYFHVVVEDASSVAALTGIISIRILQNVIFFDRRQIADS